MTVFLGQLALPAVTTSRRVPIVGLRSIMIASVTVKHKTESCHYTNADSMAPKLHWSG